jgi:iron complex outermembrane recepter protein
MCPNADGRPRKVLPHLVAVLLGLNPMGLALAQAVSFNIPAQEVATAIAEFARQAKLQIIAPADKLKGVRTHAIVGTLEIHAALEQLLNGTGLVVASDDGRTISLRFSGKTAKREPGAAPQPPTRLQP